MQSVERAIPMVDIYDDVFGDIDPTYSTIADMDPTIMISKSIVCIYIV